ncbi:MAG: tetratricopeptide repeat protein [Desulfobulbus sp.]|jgi:tetratricopeptide (TPR) repeat protein|nr:tetratricopeptide repeat protein [Desulfobulbus sp.]
MQNKAFFQAQRDFLRGDYGSSITGFGTALETGMEAARVHLPLGLAYLKNRNFAEAAAEFGRVLELRPHDDLVLFLRGMARFNNNEPKIALADLNAAIDANPGRAAAHVGRSLANRSLGHDRAAENDLRKALTLGGVEVSLFMREYCLTRQLHDLATSLFDTYDAAWGPLLRIGRGTPTTH